MEGTTSFWWDMESCPLPSYIDPYIVTSMAPALLRNFNIINSMVNSGGGCSSLDRHHFSTYEFFSETQTELHQTLLNCGIGLNQLPPGKHNEMEKMMMADVLLWTMDRPPPANIIFIVGNVDFCYVFQKLRQRLYNVFLVCQSMSEMPRGMFDGVNGCLGWLSFLRSLQNEDRHSHFPGANSVNDHTFSNAAFPASSTSIYNREKSESSNASGFNHSRENLFGLKPSFNGGWNSTCDFQPTVSDEWGSTCNFPPTVGDGWDDTCNFPSDETASSPVQQGPRFHGDFIRTKKPRSPVSSASSTEKKNSASLEEFKAWLTLVVNGKKHAEEGYNISPLRVDFEKATGKILDEKFLGFSKIINLVENCKDIAVIKEVKRGCHLAFPVKLKEQKNATPSLGGWNSSPNKGFNSKYKPRAERNPNPKPKRKASAEDFRKFIYHMLQAGEFSQGFLMSRLSERFKQHTGKFLDVEHLGFKRVSELVASYSDLVLVSCVGHRPVRIFPSGFVNEPVPNLCPNSNTIKATSINMGNDPTNLKAKVEADRPLSGGSSRELIENSAWDENISYEHSSYESHWLPMTFGSLASASFNSREANTPFQEYSIKSDSSSPRGESQISEWEGQSSAIGETTSFHGELEGSDFIKQHVSTLQWEGNDPIKDSVNAERLMAEAMQNTTLTRENTSFCEGSCFPAGTGLPDSATPPSESPGLDPQTGGCNSSLAPLQRRAESSVFCAEDLRHGIRLDCKQNELNTNSAKNEERITSVVSSGNEDKPTAQTDPKASAEDLSRTFRYHMPGPQGFFMKQGNLRADLLMKQDNLRPDLSMKQDNLRANLKSPSIQGRSNVNTIQLDGGKRLAYSFPYGPFV